MPYARRRQASINHVLDNSYGHLVRVLPARRTVVTSHGGTPKSWRLWNREGPAMRFFDWTFAGTLKAGRIIIVSEYAKRELVDNYDFDPARVDVVYHGVDERFRVLSEEMRVATRTKFLASDETHLILHVGHCADRKNVDGLLRAFNVYLKQAAKPARLLQIGGEFTASQVVIIDQANAGKHITQISNLPNAELVALYNAADLFVFPSLYEGFGVPLIEAMACGTPVVCSDYDLFREICGNAALYIETREPSRLAEAIAQVLEDEQLARVLHARGRERSSLFTWRRCATGTLESYARIAETM